VLLAETGHTPASLLTPFGPESYQDSASNNNWPAPTKSPPDITSLFVDLIHNIHPFLSQRQRFCSCTDHRGSMMVFFDSVVEATRTVNWQGPRCPTFGPHSSRRHRYAHLRVFDQFRQHTLNGAWCSPRDSAKARMLIAKALIFARNTRRECAL
jgi:hypothetical protein